MRLFAALSESEYQPLDGEEPRQLLSAEARAYVDEASHRYQVRKMKHLKKFRNFSRMWQWETQPIPLSSSHDSVRDILPFLSEPFKSLALTIGGTSRFQCKYSVPYHQRKGLVMALIPEELHSVLPMKKDIYTKVMVEQRPSGTPSLLLEHGVLQENVLRADWARAYMPMIMEVERWLREALRQGYTTVPL